MDYNELTFVLRHIGDDGDSATGNELLCWGTRLQVRLRIEGEGEDLRLRNEDCGLKVEG